MQRLMAGLVWAVIGAVGIAVISVALAMLASIGDPSGAGIGIALIFLGVPLGFVGGGIYGAFIRKPKAA